MVYLVPNARINSILLYSTVRMIERESQLLFDLGKAHRTVRT